LTKSKYLSFSLTQSVAALSSQLQLVQFSPMFDQLMTIILFIYLFIYSFIHPLIQSFNISASSDYVNGF